MKYHQIKKVQQHNVALNKTSLSDYMSAEDRQFCVVQCASPFYTD